MRSDLEATADNAARLALELAAVRTRLVAAEAALADAEQRLSKILGDVGNRRGWGWLLAVVAAREGFRVSAEAQLADANKRIEEVCAENEGLGQAHNELLRQQDRIAVLIGDLRWVVSVLDEFGRHDTDTPKDFWALFDVLDSGLALRAEHMSEPRSPATCTCWNEDCLDHGMSAIDANRARSQVQVRMEAQIATASSVPGLSVCVAQLAAIRQLCHPPHWAVPVRDLLAVLDGVPDTTQPAEQR